MERRLDDYLSALAAAKTMLGAALANMENALTCAPTDRQAVCCMALRDTCELDQIGTLYTAKF